LLRSFSGKKVIGYHVTALEPTRHVKSWRTAWRTLTKKAAQPGFGFHDLRHCAITQLAENGTLDSTIKAIADHVSRRMLERYSHVRMERSGQPWKPSPRAPKQRVMTEIPSL